MRISDWSSDVCSSDLCPFQGTIAKALQPGPRPEQHERPQEENESVDLNAAEPTVENGSIAVEQRRQDDARAHIVSDSCASRCRVPFNHGRSGKAQYRPHPHRGGGDGKWHTKGHRPTQDALE